MDREAWSAAVRGVEKSQALTPLLGFLKVYIDPFSVPYKSLKLSSLLFLYFFFFLLFASLLCCIPLLCLLIHWYFQLSWSAVGPFY